MDTLAHPLLNALSASKPSLGAWISLPGAFNACAAASSSPHISWVVIDCEHGMTSLQPGAGDSVRAIAGLGPDAPSTIVRIPASGACAVGSAAWQIKYVLDQGARGVLVPMVSNREQAESVVSAARFPPLGTRGFGNPFTQLAWGSGFSSKDYLQRANDSVVVFVQIETPDGYKNIHDILSVSGLDGIFIGPYDLSLSHGLPFPSPDPHPDAEKMIQNILAEAHAKGKICAMICTSGAQSVKRAKEGFDMITVVSDSKAMADGLSQHFAEVVGETAGNQPIPNN